MGLRFDGSLGAFRLMQWNAREFALTASLGLLSLKQRIASTSGLQAGRTNPGLSRLPVPALTKSGRCATDGQPLNAARVRRFDGPRLHPIAIALVALLLGYVGGLATVWQPTPILGASAAVAVGLSDAPEGLAPSAWASKIDAVQEALPPVGKMSTSQFATAPVSEALPLTADEVREAQAWLNAFGFSPGAIDGLPGPQTMAAVKRYRIARDMEEPGGLDQAVLKQMRQQSGHR
jgi:Putative peptidoglycan binding domain